MTTKNNSVSNRDLYDAINGLRSEFGNAIQRLDDKFMQLEAGRLTRAEGNISDLSIKLNQLVANTSNAEKTLTNKFIALGTVGIILLTGLSTAFFAWLFRSLK